jgi:hypothetical protein
VDKPAIHKVKNPKSQRFSNIPLKHKGLILIKNTFMHTSSKTNRWRTFSGELLRLPIKEAVEKAIVRETEKGYKLKVCIGTDSQVYGSETEFATVIVFLREKHGGLCSFTTNARLSVIPIKERNAGGSCDEHRNRLRALQFV